MAMAPTLSRPIDVLGAAQQDSLRTSPDGHGFADGAEAADRPGFCPAAVPIESQRERAQHEFKRIWDLCTPAH
ncbi:hypothetical protein SAMN02799631_05445 [Methylobacterium sp. 174MFSha1.1]|uniref:hypothetical protein n=1 Tax=Methylobacterium sp. 174MFSha1.1 TaxID=1502749 RepID=UPI0008EA1CCE|nr:hypothetical protein [Methylobacterium sp. 174MFSha1.1]SFV12267.1 hypothetical protein SAMN02799631_05445 [Methylobacterium sp. 174MFSha1.1]